METVARYPGRLGPGGGSGQNKKSILEKNIVDFDAVTISNRILKRVQTKPILCTATNKSNSKDKANLMQRNMLKLLNLLII